MKYLLALLIGVGGTSLYLKNTETPEQRVKQQVVDFCSCHNGVDAFVYLPDDFMGYLEVYCKDGTSMSSKGTTDTIQLGGGDNCKD